MISIDVPDWYNEGVCQGLDPAMFFPSRGDSARAAKAVCHSCPSEAQCLAYALDNDIKFGVWGGTAEVERRRMRRQRDRRFRVVA